MPKGAQATHGLAVYMFLAMCHFYQINMMYTNRNTSVATGTLSYMEATHMPASIEELRAA
jgi:hypothetical protein